MVALLVWQQLKGLDRSLVRPSPNGMLALLRYELGDYAGAARAYRADFAATLDEGALYGDDPEIALLRGDWTHARDLATRQHAAVPEAAPPLLALAELAMDGDLPQAQRLGDDALRTSPDDGDAQVIAA